MTSALTPRLQPYTETIFGAMSALATELGAVNLGQGFPDTDGPPELLAMAAANITNGVGNQYPPAHGLPELRQAIADHQRDWYGLDWDWRTDVVVTTGASEALAATMIALVEPDDEVLVLEPFFDLYPPIIAMGSGVPVAVPPGANFRVSPEAIRAAITPRTRFLIINSPNNPTGQVWTEAELAAVASIAIEFNLTVIADEAYEHLWFDGHPHIPIATLPGMADRTVTIGSGGKCLSLTGWKVGWASGPERLISAVKVARQHLSYVSGGPFQPVIAHGLQLPPEYFEDLRQRMARSGALLSNGLANLGFDVHPLEGTYFATTDVRPLGFVSGTEFCSWAPTAAGVVAIPQSALCSSNAGDPYVRWAFCKQEATLNAAITRLSAALTERDR